MADDRIMNESLLRSSGRDHHSLRLSLQRLRLHGKTRYGLSLQRNWRGCHLEADNKSGLNDFPLPLHDCRSTVVILKRTDTRRLSWDYLYVSMWLWAGLQ